MRVLGRRPAGGAGSTHMTILDHTFKQSSDFLNV